MNKYHYGIRLPVLNTKVLDNEPVNRGDVVVFRYPVDPRVDYIKRVVGLPGDTVAYADQRLSIDPVGQEIVRHLEEVAAERRARHEEPALAERVHALKDYQHRRFQQTYADLLAQPRYSEAARFFLDELYGPHDFTARDAQFARIVPALVRLFPRHIVETVSTLGHLHALSEQLDTAMARHLTELPLTAAAYAEAWRRVGRADDRSRTRCVSLRASTR